MKSLGYFSVYNSYELYWRVIVFIIAGLCMFVQIHITMRDIKKMEAGQIFVAPVKYLSGYCTLNILYNLVYFNSFKHPINA